jgi:hypothetical protein
MLADIQNILSKQLYKLDNADVLPHTIQLHHLVTAIGSIIKGFPEHSPKTAASAASCIVVFKTSLETVIQVLESVNASEIIREAVKHPE